MLWKHECHFVSGISQSNFCIFNKTAESVIIGDLIPKMCVWSILLVIYQILNWCIHLIICLKVYVTSINMMLDRQTINVTCITTKSVTVGREWRIKTVHDCMNGIPQVGLYKLYQIIIFNTANGTYVILIKQNRSTEGCSKLKRSVDMTSSGKNGLNIRTNASPKWYRTRCPEE